MVNLGLLAESEEQSEAFSSVSSSEISSVANYTCKTKYIFKISKKYESSASNFDSDNSDSDSTSNLDKRKHKSKEQKVKSKSSIKNSFKILTE